jgi:ketosteroid isomerase-like protein
MDDSLLATLAGERAIRRLISLYCDAVRRGDPDAVGELFTPDASVRIADLPERVGRQEIVEGLRRTMAGFSYLHQTCDTGLIDVKGGLARARHGVIEANRPNGAEALNLIFGAYEDEYRLSEIGWRFHRRRFDLRFRVQLPAAEFQQFPEIASRSEFFP